MNPPATGIIVQARTGSTRLPGKVLLPFHEGHSILDIIIARLKTTGLPLCIATSADKADDAIAARAVAAGVLCFRGDENDVLSRFTGAAAGMQLQHVVRVCADNPFLDIPLLEQLLDFAARHPADYWSFLVDEELPAIRSHWGIFTEIATAVALEKAERLTQDKFYHEHVTNFIYGHPEHFQCAWINADAAIFGKKDVRFTIDTPEDFALMQKLWAVLAERGIPVNFRNALHYLEEFPQWKTIMKEQIIRNSK